MPFSLKKGLNLPELFFNNVELLKCKKIKLPHQFLKEEKKKVNVCNILVVDFFIQIHFGAFKIKKLKNHWSEQRQYETFVHLCEFYLHIARKNVLRPEKNWNIYII